MLIGKTECKNDLSVSVCATVIPEQKLRKSTECKKANTIHMIPTPQHYSGESE